MLRSKPNVLNYKGNTQNVDTFNRAWNSSTFGGNVFSSMGARYADGKSWKVAPRNRNNTLLEQIKAFECQPLYGGGFYMMEGVQQSVENPNHFMDIYLLTESVFNDKDALLQMQKLDGQTRNPKGIQKSNNSNVIKLEIGNFETIKRFVTGYARIIYYKSVSGIPSPDNSEIEMVVEGEFREGLMDGYCRGISAINGSCSVGYHLAGLPQGKFCSYKLDGTFMQQEGIYEGKKITQAMKIKTFEQPIITKRTKDDLATRDLQYNQQPADVRRATNQKVRTNYTQDEVKQRFDHRIENDFKSYNKRTRPANDRGMRNQAREDSEDYDDYNPAY